MATETTTTNIKSMATSINTFVKSFLSGDDTSVEKWTSRENQKHLRAVLAGKEHKKPKQSKVDKPKKSKSAYLFFCAEERKKIKHESPDLKSVQVTMLLGQRWRELKANKARASELSKYEKLASTDNDRYMNEKESVKKALRPNSSKRVKSAYLLFCEQMRPVVKSEQPHLKAKDIIVELGRRWRLQQGK